MLQKTEVVAPKVPRRVLRGAGASDHKLWLVCTIDLDSEVLFTVPLKIAKKYKRSSYFRVFRAMAKVLLNSERDPLNFNMFRYDPFADLFPKGLHNAMVLTGYFLEDMPWINSFKEPRGLEAFLSRTLGVPVSSLDRGRMYEEANRVGSKLVKIPAAK